ncbi:chaperone protein DnaJ [Echinococcus multilocularis]|uniref:Chaperone protein DnaJ n=1 Tax=Echinococcus multilocularis TaxID=6211 RepID=A0A068Y0N6_ECHMU|nr:chaperone protein DnaJ [Echinococcus multilocularis]
MSLASRLTIVSRRLSSIRSISLSHIRGFRTTDAVKVEDLYEILGLRPNATQKEIKEAFYALSRLHHPDIAGTTKSGSKYQKIVGAYEILGDPSKRMDYDRGFVIPKTGGPPSSDFPTKIDVDMLRKAESGSFEAGYVRSYNRSLRNAWTQRADENISKSAFEYRLDQRRFAMVIFSTMLGIMLGSYAVAKYYEEPVPIVSSDP